MTSLLESPWDTNTFYGRLRHYAWITDPRLSLISTKQLFVYRDIVDIYRKTRILPMNTTIEEYRRAQQACLSAFHPNSGDLQNVVGRMSFQVPGGMLLCGCMVAFYRSTPAVVFWQWANQSFNALVNYTNAPGASKDGKKILVAYVTATSCALVTALGLKAVLAKSASTLLQRYVPFAAVAASNAVNIPLMRQNEVLEGVTVVDETGAEMGKSKYAATKGILQVFISRLVIAGPCMTLVPPIIEYLEKFWWMKKYHRFVNAPLQVFLSGLFLMVSVPVGCALFNQKCRVSVDRLKSVEPSFYKELKEKYENNLPEAVYFNKGL